MSKDKWREVNRYNIVNGEGNFEELVLERKDDGTFRIRNDFGNINIELDTMSLVELIKKLNADVDEEIEYDINNIFSDFDTEDDDDTDERDAQSK